MRRARQILSRAVDLWLRAMTILAIGLVVFYGIYAITGVTS